MKHAFLAGLLAVLANGAQAGTDVSGGGRGLVCFTEVSTKLLVEKALASSMNEAAEWKTPSDVLMSVQIGSETAIDRIARVESFDLYLQQFSEHGEFLKGAQAPEFRKYKTNSQEAIVQDTISAIRSKVKKFADELEEAGANLEWIPAVNGIFKLEALPKLPTSYPPECLVFPLAWQEVGPGKTTRVFHDVRLIAKMVPLHQAAIHLHERAVNIVLNAGLGGGTLVEGFIGFSFLKKFDDMSGVLLAQLLPKGSPVTDSTVRIAHRDYGVEKFEHISKSYLTVRTTEDVEIELRSRKVNFLKNAPIDLFGIRGKNEWYVSSGHLTDDTLLETLNGPVEFKAESEVQLGIDGLVHSGVLKNDTLIEATPGRKFLFAAGTKLGWWIHGQSERILAVHSGTLAVDTPIKIGGRELLAAKGSKINFAPTGGNEALTPTPAYIDYLVVGRPQAIKIGTSDANVLMGNELGFHQNEKIKFWRLNEKQSASLFTLTVNGYLPFKEYVSFHEDEKVAWGTLAAKREVKLWSLPGASREIKVSDKNYIAFKPSGDFEYLTTLTNANLMTGADLQVVECRAGTVGFHDMTVLRHCTPARDQDYLFAGKHYDLRRDHEAVFSEKGRPIRL
jgi:hypothetical protein